MLTKVDPTLSVAVVILGAPAIPVLAAPLRSLIALSSATMLELYCEGMAENQGAVVVAMSADSMIDSALPVRLAAEAIADWMEAGT